MQMLARENQGMEFIYWSVEKDSYGIVQDYYYITVHQNANNTCKHIRLNFCLNSKICKGTELKISLNIFCILYSYNGKIMK
jgi:hypothetical protein